MTRYYCSGFYIHNAFGHGLGEMFKRELADTQSIVFIPGGIDKIEKTVKKQYPDFQIEQGLNLDNISIYPHNNTTAPIYPDTLVVGDEIYQREDLITVAKEYGEFYLLQDYIRENGLTDVSVIKSSNGLLEYYIENEGKVWKATRDGVELLVIEDRC